MAGPPEKADDPPATGDPAPPGELAAWMAQYGGALRRYFSRQVGPGEAEDLVQEVFVRLQSRSAGGAIDNVERYLFRIAKHVLVTRYRRGRVDGLWRHDNLDDMDEPSDDMSPERILAGKQDAERVVIAILNLPPRVRTVFEAHRFGKLSYSAIAERMGISKAAVGRLMQRAIERLSDELRGES